MAIPGTIAFLIRNERSPSMEAYTGVVISHIFLGNSGPASIGVSFRIGSISHLVLDVEIEDRDIDGAINALMVEADKLMKECLPIA